MNYYLIRQFLFYPILIRIIKVEYSSTTLQRRYPNFSGLGKEFSSKRHQLTLSDLTFNHKKIIVS